MKTDCAIPAGNILVNHAEGFSASLNKDLRDTEGNWFYWKFRAVFPEKGDYSFRFENGPAIGTRGPAFSTDKGKTWNWLGMETVSRNPDSFVYRFDGSPEHAEVWFCMGIPYLQENLERFLEKKKGTPCLRKGVLCRSRKGREVELITISEEVPEGNGAKAGKKKKNLFFTSRHHSCEMMATYVLEGILDAASEDSGFGRAFRSRFDLYAVPFVDKDGVEDGDQGKFRRPHDHARDYWDTPIYPETAAIMRLIAEKQMDFILDLHCPWLHDVGNPEGTSGKIHLLSPNTEKRAAALERFGRILEEKTLPPLRFLYSDTLLFGTQWNCITDSPDGKSGIPLDKWCWKLSFPEIAVTAEIPYANVYDATFTTESAREFGKTIVRSILLYFDSSPAVFSPGTGETASFVGESTGTPV